jgi:hypothetical protein
VLSKVNSTVRLTFFHYATTLRCENTDCNSLKWYLHDPQGRNYHNLQNPATSLTTSVLSEIGGAKIWQGATFEIQFLSSRKIIIYFVPPNLTNT